MLAELQAIVAPLEIGKADQDWSPLKQLYSRKDVFGLDLYEAGLGEQIPQDNLDIRSSCKKTGFTFTRNLLIYCVISVNPVFV